MKHIFSYYGGESSMLLVVEDSEAVSLFKVASINSYSGEIPSFHTILKRPASIGTIQFMGLYSDLDSLQHQFLFWEEGSGPEQRIFYTHDVTDSTWETPRYLSPSLYRQQELIGAQTNRSTYPRQNSFTIGWNEQDSLTLFNFLSDSIISTIRIATNALTDSVQPVLSDGMLAWVTHHPSSSIRTATFNTSGSIISIDTITGSQDASHPVYLLPFWAYPLTSLYWTKTVDGIGNIVGSGYADYETPKWSTPFTVTNDTNGTNVPIFAFISPVVTKSSRQSYFSFDYLVFLRTLNDSNAFVRENKLPSRFKREYWTRNRITDIDAEPGVYINSVWIETDSNKSIVQYHTGLATPGGSVEEDPSFLSGFSLKQNYPNPFNPSTTIQYSIPFSGLVTLEIFDVLGRKILTLFHGRQSRGSHQVQWIANEFPSGFYFYRLKCNTTIISKKMLILR